MLIELKRASLDGKEIAYCSTTRFLVQVGKGSRAYKTKYEIIGNFGRAFMFYQGINVGNGYKKRLLMPSCYKNLVLARQLSG